MDPWPRGPPLVGDVVSQLGALEVTDQFKLEPAAPLLVMVTGCGPGLVFCMAEKVKTAGESEMSGRTTDKLTVSETEVAPGAVKVSVPL